jgi:nicotinamidase/pyrazinamidase
MRRRAALLVVDVQQDFCPGGALAVDKGDLVVPVLNRYLQMFSKQGRPIFASRDWHTADSTHFGQWPVHCVQESEGAAFHDALLLPKGTIVISKGMSRWDNGYSAMQGFTDNGTPFTMLLRRMNLDKLYVGGLATDYCVKESVLEALKEGFMVTVLTDAIRGVERQQGDADRALAAMVEAGAELANLESIGSLLAEEKS